MMGMLSAVFVTPRRYPAPSGGAHAAAPRGFLSGAAVVMVGALLGGCASSPATPDAASTRASSPVTAGAASGGSSVPTLTVRIKRALPWNPTSFTQGLEVLPGGDLLVGTGLNGKSRVYVTDVQGKESRSQSLPREFFGEGVTRVGDTVWQLTWKAGVAIRRDLKTLKEIGRASYDTQGWGLCATQDRLVMSDGSDRLFFRDPETFALTGQVNVTVDGQPLEKLNELECTPDGMVWANVWMTNSIVRIDPSRGVVTGVVDTSGALPAAARPGADVLNGIAAIPNTSPQQFYVTGKLWEEMYDVEFVEPA